LPDCREEKLKTANLELKPWKPEPGNR
jgi:hypothetical protein